MVTKSYVYYSENKNKLIEVTFSNAHNFIKLAYASDYVDNVIFDDIVYWEPNEAVKDFAQAGFILIGEV